MMRYTVAIDNERVCLFGKKIAITREEQLTRSLRPAPFSTKNEDHVKRYHCLKTALGYWKQLDLQAQSRIKVEYVRIFHQRIYLTATISSGGVKPEFGVVMWFNSPDPNHNESSISNEELFKIQGISQKFESSTRNPFKLPVVQGLDVDRRTGDLFIALPSKSSICSMDKDLTVMLKEWILTDPYCYPEYLCYVANQTELWASCPSEDKIVILNVITSRLLHLKPSEMFGIKPSHIVYTSDEKIITLDAEKSMLYWIAKVEMSLVVQRVNQKSASASKNRILSIQPMEKVFALPNAQLEHRSLEGGVVCTENNAVYLIFPNVSLKEPSWGQKLRHKVSM
ncbi:hypothetical protein Ciccas_013846 [Cichlidogyrus casuarinus]|uniref:Uncharacterized protein n=1 Tax=Cichlidogyrus casuarinus TaxID=1844966 RepID=A0ABD2PJI4_9PLAT